MKRTCQATTTVTPGLLEQRPALARRLLEVAHYKAISGLTSQADDVVQASTPRGFGNGRYWSDSHKNYRDI